MRQQRYHQPQTMLLLSLLSLISLSAACRSISEYLEETSQCIKNSSTFQHNATMFFEGCKTFRILVDENDIFVDKTLLLREIFKKHTYLTIFYLPHKFSKSVNLEMIRTFAEIQLNSNFSILPPKDTFAYNFFAFGKILRENENSSEQVQLYEPLLISRHIDLIDQHAAQYPAIYFNLSKLWGIQYKSSWSCFRDRVGREFKRYSFLKSRMSTDECSQFNQLFDYFNHTEWDIKLDPAIDLANSVIFLAQTVTKFFEKKPILFVDEYDSMLSQFLHKNYVNDDESEQVMTFFTNFINTVFSREDIWHRIILTGTFSLHKNMMNSLPGSKAIYHALDNDLSHFFGFTEKDVQAQAKHFKVHENDLKQMQEYYKGYQMGQLSPIYNPWSVMRFFRSKQLTNHWEDETKSKWFMTHMWGIEELGEHWLDFLSDRAEFSPRPFEEFSKTDLQNLRNTLDFCISRDPSAQGNIGFKKVTQTLMYQADMGYLTWSNYPTCDSKTMFNLRIANYEIKKATYDKLRKTYQGYLGIDITKADNATSTLHAYLFSRQREEFLEILTQSFECLFSRPEELLEGNSNSSNHEFNETNEFYGNFTEINENHSPVRNDSASKLNIISKHIIDYVGLQLKYYHGYQLDRKINNGFIVCKQNVSSMVVFNNNQSIDNTDILNQIDNYTHPWTELGSQAIATSVTYIVISVTNGTKICTRRYGDEPPIEITTPAPVKTTPGKKTKPPKLQTTKPVPKSPKTKKMKSGSKFNPNVTKSLDDSLRNQTRVTNAKVVMTKCTHNANSTNLATRHSSCTVSTFQGSSLVSEFNPQVTKSATQSSANKATDATLNIKTMETQMFNHKTELTKNPTTKSTEGTIKNDATKSMPIIETQNHTTDPNKVQQKNDPNMAIILTNARHTNLVHQTQPTLPSSTESKSTLEVTKSSNESEENKTITTQTLSTAQEGITIYTNFPISQFISDKFSTTVFAESSLRQITRVTRSIPVGQSPSETIVLESQSGSNFTSELTTSSNGSPTNEIKGNNSEGITLSSSDLTTITTITQGQPPSSPSSSLSTGLESKSNLTVTKLSNESITNEIKVTNIDTTLLQKSITPDPQSTIIATEGSKINDFTTITTITPDQSTSSSSSSSSSIFSSSPVSNSTNEKSTSDSKSTLLVAKLSNESVTIEIKVTDINTTLSKTNNSSTIINYITPDFQSSSSAFTAKVSKSSPQFTKSANQSFTKKQKVKNLNATTFVKKNWTKITKERKPQGSFSTISMNETSQSVSKLGSNFTRPSRKPFLNKTRIITTLHTTESLPTTTIEYWTRSRRTFTRGTPKSTTVSRVKFLKMLFNYRG